MDEGTPHPRAVNAVRVATVDNFQGEESKIVIICLVRSNNKMHEIGFLSDRERINVMLSRARDGMYVVGNLDFITACRNRKGRELWTKIRGVFADTRGAQLLPYFPAQCANHGVVQKITSGAEFQELCPDGGCKEPCMQTLPCSHRCPHKCHDHATDAPSITCKEKVPDVCPFGHPVQRICSSTTAPRCTRKESWLCTNGTHVRKGLCHERTKGQPAGCKECTKADKEHEELQATLAKQKEERLQHEAHLQRLKLQQAHVATTQALAGTNALLQREIELTTAALKESSASARPRPASNSAVVLPSTSVARNSTRNAGEGTNTATQAPVPTVMASPVAPVRRTAAAPDARGEPATDEILKSILQASDTDPTRAIAKLNAQMAQTATQQTGRDGWLGTWQALKYILGTEAGDTMPHADAVETVVTLSDAVRAVAHVLYTCTDFPHCASTQMAQVEAFQQRHPGVLPTRWDDLRSRIVQPAPGVDDDVEVLPPSKAAAAWSQVQASDRNAPPVMEEILKMTGLEEVKQTLISMYHRVKLDLKRGDDTGASTYNARFDGNPGTGKTTIARHYGTFLQQLGVLAEQPTFIELTAATCMHGGIELLEEKLDEVKAAKGGVIFIDEAYQLKTDRQGEKILDFILPLASKLDTKYGPVVWVFAGYKKDMEKLFEHNPGLPSRFPHRFHFADFSDEELLAIFTSLLQNEQKRTTTPSPAKKSISPATRAGNSFGNPYNSYGNRGVNRSRYMYGMPPAGTQEQDAFGNTWTFDGRGMWNDQYNNTSGMGVDGLGTAQNPVVNVNGQWTFDAGTQTWSTDSNVGES